MGGMLSVEEARALWEQTREEYVRSFPTEEEVNGGPAQNIEDFPSEEEVNGGPVQNIKDFPSYDEVMMQSVISGDSNEQEWPTLREVMEQADQKYRMDYEKFAQAFKKIRENFPNAKDMELEDYYNENRLNPKYQGGGLGNRAIPVVSVLSRNDYKRDMESLSPEAGKNLEVLSKKLSNLFVSGGKSKHDGGKIHYNNYDALYKNINKEVANHVLLHGKKSISNLADVLKESSYIVLETVDEDKPYQYHAVKDGVVESYLENMAEFGVDGSIEKAFNDLKKDVKNPSREAASVLDALNKMKANFLNKEAKTPGDAPTSNGLPSFHPMDLQKLRTECGKYMEMHGYKDNKENKMIREISLQADRMFMNFEARNEYGSDQTSMDPEFRAKMEKLNERLSALSGSLTGNSAEFKEMASALKHVTEGNHYGSHALDDLLASANEYMEAKGSSKRSTSKGQLRYDIAREIAELVKDAVAANEDEKERVSVEPTMFHTSDSRHRISLKDLTHESASKGSHMSSEDRHQMAKEYNKIVDASRKVREK